MTTKVEIQEREQGGNVLITLPNGNLYRITFVDSDDGISINTVDGGMIIQPRVTNQITIKTDTQ